MAERDDPFADVVSVSPAMVEVRRVASRVAPTNLTVLITGESGSGKEVLARCIHRASERAGRPMIVVDCATIPVGLIDSELFGHARGAFTGAQHARKGLVEAADGGTFFLDEVGDLPAPLQVKLLRLLESGEYRPVGETGVRHADLRIIAATNRPITQAVRMGTFRADLYHRLDGVHIHIPPLRDRPEDIRVLLLHYLERFAREAGRERIPELSPALWARLEAWSWPGNVRELVNCARYLACLGPADRLEPADLPPALRDAPERRPLPRVDLDLPYMEARRRWLDAFEDAYLGRLLARHDGNISAAARAAGISRRSIHRWLARTRKG